MEIKDLKKQIENKTIDNSFKIFILADDTSSIISKQYINAISDILKLEIKCIDSFDEIPDQSFVVDNNLYVIYTDKWESSDSHENCIVVCKSSKESGCKIPKLESWQLVDYLIPKLNGLNKSEIENIVEMYQDNYGRCLLDLDKVSIFNKGSQEVVFNSMMRSGEFDDVTNLKIWDLSNSILRRDIRSVKTILNKIKYIDVEPLGLITLMYKGFKQIINIQCNRNCTANELGISDKQLYVIKKYNCGHYSNEELFKILKIITNLEYMFKFGELSLDNMIDYIIVKTLGV